MVSSSAERCRQCGAVLLAGGPAGLCAKCLLTLGLQIEAGRDEGGDARGEDKKEELSDDLARRSESPAVGAGSGLNAASAGASLREKAGDKIGRCTLVEQIGEGGFGVVYKAEQKEPVRRQVALKIIKLGMDTKQVVARFETERHALELMDHPNIAKILDAGATETGRPYFVMELVEGIKITDYCDLKRLSTRQRLNLFIPICQAVQHAHQKGVIHRDIKPSNILVTSREGAAVPKIIDFGIAKATQAEVTEQTVFTQLGHFLGTPAYMSPEQVELGRMDIDTRTDIYSIGVLLYELLTGRAPFGTKELLAHGFDELRRTIREQEPPTPSTRVNQELLALRPTAPGKSEMRNRRSQVDKDLDWIVMKCLEKDRARRYETANGLAMDIERYLRNEPVLASPPDALDRFQKLVRRNLGTFIAGAIILLLLIAGIAVSGWQAVKARRAEGDANLARNNEVEQRRNAQSNERKARTEAAKSQQVVQLLKEMLASVGPSRALGRDTTMLREILDKTAVRIANELTNQPEVEVELCEILAETYGELGMYTQMETIAQRSLRVARTYFGDEHTSVANALTQIGDAQFALEGYEQAEATHREALALKKRLFGDEHLEIAASQVKLAWALDHQAKWEEAGPLFRQALAMRRKLEGAEHLDVARSLSALATSLVRETGSLRSRPDSVNAPYELLRGQKLTEAESLQREALAIEQKSAENGSPEVAVSLNSLGLILAEERKLEEAEDLYRKALSMHRKIQGDTHPNVYIVLHNLSVALRREGKLGEIEELYPVMVEIKQKLLAGGEEVPDKSLYGLANLLASQGKLTDAQELARHALRARRKLVGDEHPSVARAVSSLVDILVKTKQITEAEAVFNDVLTPALERRPGGATLLQTRADFLVRLGRYREGADDLAKTIEFAPSDHMLYHKIMPLLVAGGALDKYYQYRQKIIEEFAGTQDGRTADRMAKDCLILPASGTELTAACELAETSVKANTYPDGRPWSLFCKGLAEYRAGRFESAANWAAQALALAETKPDPHCLDVESCAVLAMSRYQLGQKDDACTALAQGAAAIARKAPNLPNGDPGPDWGDVLIGQALLGEAKSLIEEQAAPAR